MLYKKLLSLVPSKERGIKIQLLKVRILKEFLYYFKTIPNL